MSLAEPVRYQACPECGASLPVFSGYVVWCHNCDWNVNPAAKKRLVAGGRLRELYGSIGRRQGRELYEQVARIGPKPFAFKIEMVPGFLLATVVHGLTLGSAALGVVLAVTGWPRFVPVTLALFCLAMAYILFPRFSKLPHDTLSPETHRAFYDFVNAVAAEVGAPVIKRIAVDARFNASYTQSGLRRSGVLVIGLPLWVVLDERERLALVAHELAHRVNGDARRGLYLGGALYSLAQLYNVLRPGYSWTADRHLRGLAQIAAGIMWLFSSLPRLLNALLMHSLWRNAQQAEYYADSLAAQVAGSEAVIAMLEKLDFANAYVRAAQRVSSGGRNIDMFDLLRDFVADVPERERQRLRRLQELEDARLDSTHPPTAYRLALLRDNFTSPSSAALARANFVEIDRGLQPLRENVQQLAINSFRSYQNQRVLR